MLSDTIASRHDSAVLVAAARDGDADAWKELFQRYNGLVAATIRSFRLWGPDLEDVSQNTWLKLLEHLPGIRCPEHVAAWLITTARRECLATLRRGRRETPVDELWTAAPDGARGPEDEALQGDLVRALDDAVDELMDSRQELLSALFFEPLAGYADVSKRTGLPIGSIGPTRARVLTQLRDRLERQGYGPVTAIG